MSKEGGGAKRFFLLGTDYVLPAQTTNKILRAFLKVKASPSRTSRETYTPFGHSDYQTTSRRSKAFGPAATPGVSTINGDSNVPFYKSWETQA